MSASERERITGENLIDWTKYEAEIAGELKEKPEEEILQKLEGVEKTYIQRQCGVTQKIFDTSIFESKYWLDAIRNDDFNDHYKVAEALSNHIINATVKNAYGILDVPYGEKNMMILCAHPRLNNGNEDHWYLLNIGTADEIEEFKKSHNLTNDALDVAYLDEISRRAYPFSMLEGDKDFWREMEIDKDSNFILSGEELEIVSQPITFPLFLTGRAGSGKSTMLQYLYADYFLRYLEFPGVKPPVYLSYSSNLIENAKKLATNLFSKNHAYTKKLNELGKSFVDDIKPQFDNVFHVFQQLVRKCIDENVPDVLQRRFASNRYVSFAKYKQAWTQKFGKERKAWQEYGPALSWHVIRTYIKGWDAEEYLAPESYKDIGRDNKSVSDENFEKVYKKVWENWYQELQEKEGWWDDQDLVRYCLAPDDDACETCVSEKFGAIFCDESQDFTRVEIEFILRLSLYSHRRIFDANTLKQLPFIFAGDEFQTLNPTGFSWNSLRSYFTERLIHATALSQNIGAPAPVTLTRNYRSTAPVVKLANRLQLLRQTRCGNDKKFTPQIPNYAESNADAVYCLKPDDPLVWKQLTSMGVVLIIPCEEGQSPKEYIEKSPLKDKIEFYEDGMSKYITICNPIQAKGLEYPNVAIYGFDNVKELKLQQLAKWYGAPVEDSDASEVELKYFLSNAYVSATRAKNKLFILTNFDRDSFWAFAFSSENMIFQKEIDEVANMMLSKIQSDESSSLGYIVMGDVNSITDENIVNAKELALYTEKQAHAQFDPGFMRQAAARYREQGKAQDVLRCEAYALRYEGSFLQAAKKFEEILDFNSACDDYWEAGNTEEPKLILEAICKLKTKTTDFRVEIAEHAVKKASLTDLKRDLYDLEQKLNGPIELKDKIMNTSVLWKYVLNAILAKIPNVTPAQQNDVKILIKSAEKLKAFGIIVEPSRLARLAFSAEAYVEAVKIWKNFATKDQPMEYHQAQCMLLNYPDNLVHREPSREASWQNKIVEDFRSNPDAKLDGRQQKIVAHALLALGTIEEAKENLAYLWAEANSIDDAHKLGQMAQKREIPYATDCIEFLFALRWTDIGICKIPLGIFQSNELNSLLTTLVKVKQIKSSQFLKKMNDALGIQKVFVKDFMEQELQGFSRQHWNWLLFYEMGNIMEKRGYFIDAQRYYEWTQRHTDDQDLKREMSIRWIACKERQAEDKGDSGNDLWREAEAKRTELGLALNYEIPQEAKFSRWQWLFSKVLSFSPSKKEKKTKAPQQEAKEIAAVPPALTPDQAPVMPIGNLSDILRKKYLTPSDSQRRLFANALGSEIPSDNSKFVHEAIQETVTPSVLSVETVSTDTKNDKQKQESVEPHQKEQTLSDVPMQKSSNDRPNRFFDYVFTRVDFQGYKLRYNPYKSELIIKLESDDEDFSVCIKKGKFSTDSGFAIDGMKLIKEDSKEETPFGIIINETEVKIILLESMMEMIFPLN